MAKITIIEGNSNDKDNVRAYMVKGEKGDVGPANTLTIGEVTETEEAEASITGEAPTQTLNLGLPKADPNTLEIGIVKKGEEASASITGDAPHQTLNLTLPKGDTGEGLPGFEVPTGSIIGWDSNNDIPEGYEELITTSTRLELPQGYSHFSSMPLTIQKIGNIVSLSGRIKLASNLTNTQIDLLTLSSEYRPKQNTPISVFTGTSSSNGYSVNNVGSGNISTGGTIYLRNASSQSDAIWVEIIGIWFC